MPHGGVKFLCQIPYYSPTEARGRVLGQYIDRCISKRVWPLYNRVSALGGQLSGRQRNCIIINHVFLYSAQVVTLGGCLSKRLPMWRPCHT